MARARPVWMFLCIRLPLYLQIQNHLCMGQHDQLLRCVMQSFSVKILRVSYLPGMLSVGIQGDSCSYGATTREVSASLLRFVCTLKRSDCFVVVIFLASTCKVSVPPISSPQKTHQSPCLATTSRSAPATDDGHGELAKSGHQTGRALP